MININSLSSVQALVLACVIAGCATAGLITGHVSSSDFLGILAGLGIVGGTVTTAHVVGTQVNTAAGTNPTPAPAPSPAPPAPVSAVPAVATPAADPAASGQAS